MRVTIASCLVIFAAVYPGCAYLQQRRAAEQAHQQAVQAARNACYRLSSDQVYQETYALLESRYPIARENERRLFVTTDWDNGSPIHSKVDAEIDGDTCLRVVLRVTAEQKGANGSWTPDDDAATSVGDDLYLTLDQRMRQDASSAVAGGPAHETAPAPGGTQTPGAPRKQVYPAAGTAAPPPQAPPPPAQQ